MVMLAQILKAPQPARPFKMGSLTGTFWIVPQLGRQPMQLAAAVPKTGGE